MRSPTALACGVNLKKSTLRLVKHASSSNDPAIPASSYLRPNYRLDFTFDSLTPCDVKLFWVVKEVEENGELGFRLRRLHHLPQPTTYHFPSGMNQRFTSPILPLYTMSLPELTMQGLPSTSIRMIQKRNQRMWQEAQNLEEVGGDDAMTTGERARKNKGDKIGTKAGKIGAESKYGVMYPNLEDDFKPIMEDQYFSLVIVIEATKEYKATGPVRSLPTPAADSPGLYLVENQAISTFACFNINSEGGFEIKVMKQKVWINSTNYLVQEIFGFTDSVASAPAKTNETAATKAAQSAQQGPSSDKHLSRSLSRMSRAESIASRVDELTKARPKRKKKSLKHKSEGDVNPSAEPSNREVTQVRRSSKEGTVAEPDATEAGPETWRSSVASASAASQTTQTDSAEARTTANIDEEQNGDRKPPTNDEQGQDEEREDGEGGEGENGGEEEEEGEEEEDEEEPNLVLLDAPECVICLSDVKDTIVLPCRHFCICSECGDVLRRRAPQRCPICRQVFQALLHIASTSTHKPEFAMVHSPALRPLTDDVIHGQNTQYIRA
ncbi:MAG: hypothetical protein J3Q66DRAFT_349658 [Benniella sp.]|nr:MAG: hypothetical protein J3Q66DRAFT_349658 [Benniella sp.]